MNISVAIASYNGENYISEQLDSIISVLKEGDEIIISDQFSSDSTPNILKDYCEKFNFIKVVEPQPVNISNDPKNSIKISLNFKNAILNCSNEIIVLCDQDDVWFSNRLELIRNAHEKYDCVVVNAQIYELDSQVYSTIYELLHPKTHFISNFLKFRVLGCQLSFRADFISKHIDVPIHKDMTHDWWWFLHANLFGKIYIENQVGFKYRRHTSNNSGGLKPSTNSLQKKLWLRMVLLGFLLKSIIKSLKGKKV